MTNAARVCHEPKKNMAFCFLWLSWRCFIDLKDRTRQRSSSELLKISRKTALPRRSWLACHSSSPHHHHHQQRRHYPHQYQQHPKASNMLEKNGESRILARFDGSAGCPVARTRGRLTLTSALSHVTHADKLCVARCQLCVVLCRGVASTTSGRATPKDFVADV